MTQVSWPWPGHLIGDAAARAPYTSEFFAQFFMGLFFTYDRTKEGVVDTGRVGLTGGLFVTPGVDQVSVGTGAAIVDGCGFASDAAEVIVIPAAVAAARIDRIVLRKHYSPVDPLNPYAVRLVRIAGVEGGGAPAVVQDTSGTTYWDISLAQVTSPIGGGLVTVVPEVQAVRTPLGPGYQEAVLPALDNAHPAAGAWVDIGAPLRIVCGPGKWKIWAEIIGLPLGGGNIGARIYNQTLGTILCQFGDVFVAGQLLNWQLSAAVQDFGVITEVRLQYFPINVGDNIFGVDSGRPTHIYAQRVV